ncbi:MAG TPA: hypothetical protein VFD75_10835 [Pyrinomonadaceae bacterium]|nr:hypothetical protein [Pyrinomonadaceae bacterium]
MAEAANTGLGVADFRTGIRSDKLHAFCGAIWIVAVAGDNSSTADGRATESGATVLFLGGGDSQASI